MSQWFSCHNIQEFELQWFSSIHDVIGNPVCNGFILLVEILVRFKYGVTSDKEQISSVETMWVGCEHVDSWPLSPASSSFIHLWKLTWNTIMEVLKMIFPLQMGDFQVPAVNYRGVSFDREYWRNAKFVCEPSNNPKTQRIQNEMPKENLFFIESQAPKHRGKRCFPESSAWWLNQPIWKILARQIGSSPQFSVKIKNIWNQPDLDKKKSVQRKWCFRFVWSSSWDIISAWQGVGDHLWAIGAICMDVLSTVENGNPRFQGVHSPIYLVHSLQTETRVRPLEIWWRSFCRFKSQGSNDAPWCTILGFQTRQTWGGTVDGWNSAPVDR